jgi:hypothetical protein
MKLKVIIITLFVAVFLTSCTSPDGGFTRDDANDVKLMFDGMEADRLYSNAGYNTNYGLAATALVVLKSYNEADNLNNYHIKAKKIRDSSDQKAVDRPWKSGQWRVRRYVSSDGTSVKITASLRANYLSEIPENFKSTALNLSCTKGRGDIKAFIDFGESAGPVSIEPKDPVWIRFDKDEPLVTYWDSKWPLNNHKVPFHILATGISESPGNLDLRDIKLLIGYLKNRKQMLIQITPTYPHREMVFNFRISGFSNAIKDLEDCSLRLRGKN